MAGMKLTDIAEIDAMISAQHMVYQSHVTELSNKIEYLLENYVLLETQDSFTFPDGERWSRSNPKTSSLMQADGFPD